MTQKEVTENRPRTDVSNGVAVEPVAHRPSQEEIAKLAYFFWEERDRQGGLPDADWLRAERELRALGPQTPAR